MAKGLEELSLRVRGLGRLIRGVAGPRISLVTPALNCASCIERNLASVRAQGLEDWEWEQWVIDGGSTDGTVGILERTRQLRYVSEKDRGLSDAVNKGLRRAEGEWLIWLNADDALEPGALRRFLDVQPAYPDTWMFCAREKIFRYDGSLETVEEGRSYRFEELIGPQTAVNQASTVVHRRVYERVGLMDEAYRYAMDYEWTVRASREFRCQPLDFVIAHYHRRPGSIMDKGIAGQHREFLRVRRRYGCSVWDRNELRLRWFLWSEPLRRVRWLRRVVRRVKALAGREPLHPMSPS
jgi:glycosyltransferase involved in cell wall biosynthesis